MHILCIGEITTILRIYCALEKEVQSCAYIAHWRKKYNLAQMLRIIFRIEEISTILRKSCANLAHILRIEEITTILRIYCALKKEVQSCANVAHIFRIEKISTILHKSCAYIAHWEIKYNLAQRLRIYCALEKEVQSCAYIAHWYIQCASCASCAKYNKPYFPCNGSIKCNPGVSPW